MSGLLSSVEWVEHNEMMDELLNEEDGLATHAMEQGFEAEVMMIRSDQESFVYKVWNKTSKPDICFQYRLLNVLVEQGLPVPRPVGWGIDANSNKVMLTTHDGAPVFKLDEKQMTNIADILSHIHQMGGSEMGDLYLPKYDFVDYFFPRIEEHGDIYQSLKTLIPLAAIKQERLIHGDFHLGNIVESHGRYTVIDWTNGQLGDPRYDFAWSLILKKIYTPERYAHTFYSAYCSAHPIHPEELEVFEAMACLRWILLYRYGGTPQGPHVMDNIKRLVTNNRFINKQEYFNDKL